MVNVKISLSDKSNDIIGDLVDELGIKKAEFVKNLVIEKLRDIKLRGGK